MAETYKIKVIKADTGEVVKTLEAVTERAAERFEKGLNINMNHADYYTVIEPPKATPVQAGEYPELPDGLVGAILGAAYDFRDAHLAGSKNLKCSAHVELEATVIATLRTAPAGAAQALDAQELRTDVARAIWEVMREYEDSCDLELEDIGCSHVVWQLANAAIAAQQGVK